MQAHVYQRLHCEKQESSTFCPRPTKRKSVFRNPNAILHPHGNTAKKSIASSSVALEPHKITKQPKQRNEKNAKKQKTTLHDITIEKDNLSGDEDLPLTVLRPQKTPLKEPSVAAGGGGAAPEPLRKPSRKLKKGGEAEEDTTKTPLKEPPVAAKGGGAAAKPRPNPNPGSTKALTHEKKWNKMTYASITSKDETNNTIVIVQNYLHLVVLPTLMKILQTTSRTHILTGLELDAGQWKALDETKEEKQIIYTKVNVTGAQAQGTQESNGVFGMCESRTFQDSFIPKQKNVHSSIFVNLRHCYPRKCIYKSTLEKEEENTHPMRYFEDNDYVEQFKNEIVSTFLHELAHHMQYVFQRRIFTKEELETEVAHNKIWKKTALFIKKTAITQKLATSKSYADQQFGLEGVSMDFERANSNWHQVECANMCGYVVGVYPSSEIAHAAKEKMSGKKESCQNLGNSYRYNPKVSPKPDLTYIQERELWETEVLAQITPKGLFESLGDSLERLEEEIKEYAEKAEFSKSNFSNNILDSHNLHDPIPLWPPTWDNMKEIGCSKCMKLVLKYEVTPYCFPKLKPTTQSRTQFPV